MRMTRTWMRKCQKYVEYTNISAFYEDSLECHNANLETLWTVTNERRGILPPIRLWLLDLQELIGGTAFHNRQIKLRGYRQVIMEVEPESEIHTFYVLPLLSKKNKPSCIAITTIGRKAIPQKKRICLHHSKRH